MGTSITQDKLTTASKKQPKQQTIDDVIYQFNVQKPKDANQPTKAIIISQLSSAIKENELALSVEFTLLPSKLSFSKINIDSYFENHLLASTTLAILQSALLNSDFVVPVVLDMKGIGAGNYLVRVEMYEPWDPGEKLSFTQKETTIDYVPQTRESQWVKIPTVKSISGSNLTVVSSSAKKVYQNLEQNQKKESMGKRDSW